jgi:hypothetical protein
MPLPRTWVQVERRNWAKKRAATHTRIFKCIPAHNSHSDVGTIDLPNIAHHSAPAFQSLCAALSQTDKQMTFGIAHCSREANFRKIFLFPLRKEY